MSQSPHPPAHPPSPPTPASNSQLAAILSDSFRENEQLKRDVHTYRRRAEKAEKLVQTFQKIADASSQSSSSSQPNGSPNGHINHALQDLPDNVVRIVLELEDRTQRAEMAQQEAEARKAMIVENWHQLDRHLSVVELRTAEARAGFNRIVQEGGSGQLQLSQVPVHNIGNMGPPISNSSKRRGTTSGAPTGSSSFPPLNLPPIPSAAAPRMVRARTPSIDSSTQYPPNKRARGNSDEMSRGGVRGAYSESHIDYPQPHHPHVRTHHSHARMIHPPDAASSAAPGGKYPPRSRSRSSSNSSLDEMILQASTLNSSAVPPGGRRDPAPIIQPGGHVQYQTHVFAPVVTGAPQKKTKYAGPAPVPVAPPGAPSAQGSVGNVAGSAPSVPFPPTNEQGQRICRQCGLPGRYKEGKCVEKWGPGPMGPGTVCDRCRKKMKRVERRGTLENQQLQQQQLQAAHTLGIPIAQQQQQQQRALPHHQGIHRSDTILNASSASIGGSMSFRREERDESMQNHSNVRTMLNSPGKRPPPSPGPSIAALVEDDDDRSHDRDQLPTSDVGRGAAAAASSRSSSRNGNRPSGRGTPRPTNGHLNVAKRSPLSRSPGGMDVDETDADADADAEPEGEAEVMEEDGEGEADEDAEAELLDAVNAAEANSSSSGRKSEGI